MTISSGTRLGPYEILSPLGEFFSLRTARGDTPRTVDPTVVSNWTAELAKK